MAQRVITQLIDDLTGDTIDAGAGRTVAFEFDGSSFEIDLTDQNAAKLRDVLSDYIAAARRLPRRPSRTAASSKRRSDLDDTARIRVWAMANGHQIAA